jgi:hypothetical protein
MQAHVYLARTLQIVAHAIRAQKLVFHAITGITWRQQPHVYLVRTFHNAQHAIKRLTLV